MPSHSNHKGFVIDGDPRTFRIRYRGEHGETLIASYVPKTDDEHVFLHNAMVGYTEILFQLSEGELYLVKS
jgi:hypothetical protein